MANKWFFKEIRRIHASDLRALCVKNDWYTRGDNEEYGHLLFDLAGHKDNITTDDVCEIVQDIIDHSDLLADDFENVAYEVLRIAVTTLVFNEKD